jgi:NAD(P)-dependent dehydrogenase (short-subunit alcohol dehydrogenase family)
MRDPGRLPGGLPGRFAGRHVLVTGSTGMAASAAHAIAAEGGAVFATSRTAAHLEALAAEVRAAGGDLEWHAADLRDEAEVEAAFAAFDAAFGRLDAVYAVAGISGRRFGDGPIHEATLDGWHAVVAANATSQFLVARASIRRMLAQEPDAVGQRGALLLMSSALATHPAPAFFATHAYAASKGAVEGLARSLAAAYAPAGIRVNAIAPSLVATPMSRRAREDPAILAYLADKQPLAGGPIEADAVSAVALWLLSHDARMVTGQIVAVDGGWSVSEPRPAGAPEDPE